VIFRTPTQTMDDEEMWRVKIELNFAS
jgi:hypothetical protein